VQGHVLVVEDSELVTSALSVLLESAGHRVSIAGSVAEALALSPAEPRSLVLLDLTLPDGDGLALVDPLRALRWNTVVALTGHDDPDTRARCISAGCVDVLVKPVPARELVSKVATWLG
jgi:two-component system, NtrC family, response regulator AtoC